jgi:VanZ family protein
VLPALFRIALLLSALVLSTLPGPALAWLGRELPWFMRAWRALDGVRGPFDLSHVALFAVVGCGLSLTRRWPLHWWDGLRIWLTLLACSLASEAVQVWVPGRDGHWLDVRDDMLGAALGILVGMAVRGLWGWGRREG